MGEVIETERYKDELVKTLAKHGFGPEILEFVDEVPNDPLRACRVYKIEKKIVMKKRVTPEEKEININFLFEKFPEHLAQLSDDLKFLKQLVLFEMFHIVYRYQTDYECAKWGFYHLNK
ncbi:MAG: hypothetical protein HY954_01725 [Deltaproteobacteria bacterium]|nr:hypothetical protein [Deltaproteobacteria bacterium]